MADFSPYFVKLMRHEGGYVDDPVDRGGATNKGITFRTFQAFARSNLGIEPTPENHRALTIKQASVIYRNQYWNVVQGDKIPWLNFAEMICDWYINSGTWAITALQRMINRRNGMFLVIDGDLGPNTLAGLLELADPELAYIEYKLARKEYYRTLVRNNPSQEKFLKGWLARVESFPDQLSDGVKSGPTELPASEEFSDLLLHVALEIAIHKYEGAMTPEAIFDYADGIIKEAESRELI